MKKRILVLLTVVAVMVVMLAMSVAPALASSQGGNPPTGSCGVSKEAVHKDIQDPRAPGASESGHADFNGCQGKG